MTAYLLTDISVVYLFRNINIQSAIKTNMDTTFESQTSENAQDTDQYKHAIQLNIESNVPTRSGNPEMWAIWYWKIYGDLFNTVDAILKTPISNENISESDIYDLIIRGLNDIAVYTEHNDDSRSTLRQIAYNVRKFDEQENGEMMIVIEICGPDTSIKLTEKHVDNGLVSVDFNTDLNNSEKAQLNDYKGNIIKKFCSPTPVENRPNKRFKRKLRLSFNKTNGNCKATIDLRTKRMKYTLFEKFCSKLNLPSPYEEEPIKRIK